MSNKSLGGLLLKATKEPKFKPHVGRLFRLRKVKQMEGYAGDAGDGRPALGDGQRIIEPKKDIGEIVMVLDETNTRVCVPSADGLRLWISKFYLGSEVRSKSNHQGDTIESVIQELMSLSTSMLEQKNIEQLSETLQNIANKLRGLK